MCAYRDINTKLKSVTIRCLSCERVLIKREDIVPLRFQELIESLDGVPCKCGHVLKFNGKNLRVRSDPEDGMFFKPRSPKV